MYVAKLFYLYMHLWPWGMCVYFIAIQYLMSYSKHHCVNDDVDTCTYVAPKHYYVYLNTIIAL